MMRFSAAYLVLLCAGCVSAKPVPAPNHAPQPDSMTSGDPRIAVHLQSDSLVLCEDRAPFALLETAWLGNDPAPSAGPPEVSWTSADSTIVVIDSRGQLRARTAGKTYVIATVKWGTATATRRYPVKVYAGRMDVAASDEQGRLVCVK